MFALFMFIIVEFVFLMIFILVGFGVISSGLWSLLVELLVTVLAFLLLLSTLAVFFMWVSFIIAWLLVASFLTVVSYKKLFHKFLTMARTFSLWRTWMFFFVMTALFFSFPWLLLLVAFIPLFAVLLSERPCLLLTVTKGIVLTSPLNDVLRHAPFHQTLQSLMNVPPCVPMQRLLSRHWMLHEISLETRKQPRLQSALRLCMLKAAKLSLLKFNWFDCLETVVEQWTNWGELMIEIKYFPYI